MSIIGSFANKVFKVSSNHLYTFDEFTMNSELKIDEQEVDGSKPSTYIKGPGLDKVSLNVSLIKQKNIDVRNEIDEWKKIKDSKIPYHLIIGNRNLATYKFLLTNVDVSETKIGVSGEYLKAKVQLQFSEYVRAGKKEENTTTSSSSNDTTKSSTKSTSKKSTAGTTKSSKKSKKRKNKNASKSKSKNKTSKSDNSKIEALEKELYG
ncbi:phage tail protein [Romboutsia sp. 1001713B170131_170501_G6]|uniref:phage tail protein n=1 Tax=Romboutsia sp. 1001713B170131_170501_G6 TaxID=2787108 RepID=UPI0018AB58AE|nr:phage tail protein [Romboutsia sp. 1001713B170131_170501_G6]